MLPEVQVTALHHQTKRPSQNQQKKSRLLGESFKSYSLCFAMQLETLQDFQFSFSDVLGGIKKSYFLFCIVKGLENVLNLPEFILKVLN